MEKIDYAKLLGFAAVTDRLSEGVDFQDETISARLGAKVGGPEVSEPAKLIETAEK
jgi:Rad3-related DNA helicase